MLEPAALLTDGAVLCRHREIRVFGWAEEGREVCVRLQDAQGALLAEACCTAGEGRFLARLAPQQAQSGCTLCIACGPETVLVRDVAIGEVFLAGGQSNMELELQNADEGPGLMAAHCDPLLRYFNVPKRAVWNEEARQARDAARWAAIAPGTGGDMSAVAYFFARKVREREQVPVGVIDCYWGGTSVTCWMDEEALRATREGTRYLTDYAAACGGKTMAMWQREEDAFQAELAAWNRCVEDCRRAMPGAAWQDISAAAGPCPWHPPVGPGSPYRPAGLAETMLRQVIPMTLTGVIFYQGEEDAARTACYEVLLESLIRRWRQWFRDDALPFLFVQLPVWIAAGEADAQDWPVLRHAQELAWQHTRHTGMAVIIDCGEWDNIHPTDKRTVGERLFEQARSVIWGEAGECSPRALSKETEGPVLTVRLSAPVQVRGGGEPACLEIAGEDGVYAPACAAIDGACLHLTCAAVPRPVFARYAHRNWCRVNLFGENGLPLAPFILEA